jgi:predicted ribosome quality control (RQC) complex YloA/Tae2 family protein
LTLAATELDDVAHEIGRLLDGRSVQKVIQPDDTTVLLGLRGGWLLVSADPRAGRMHLVDGKPPGTGEAAPAFCMLLRKELTGLPLQSVTAVAGERAAELVFAFQDHVRRLRLFLYGASAQLQLVDGERVIAHIGPGKRVHAELPPPRPQAGPDGPDVKAQRRFPRDEPSAAIAAHYATTLEDRERAQIDAQRRAALKKQERLVAALERDIARVVSAADRRKWADLLLAHLHEVPKGASAVTLPDEFSDGSPLEIPLDPSRSARDNAARFYKEHKRMSRARAAIEQRLADAVALRDRLVRGDVVPPRGKRQQSPGQRGRAERPPPYREFKSSTNATILVGRGADRNDELTFKVARGNDLWLHTRDYAGAHVVVPTSGRPVDGETLLDAATLAAHHSQARGESQVDVTYVPRKNVRKPPKSAPGSVTHSGGKTIRVRLEPERLKRLLASRLEDT